MSRVGAAAGIGIAARPPSQRPSWSRRSAGDASTPSASASASSSSSSSSSSFAIPLRRKTRSPEESPCFWCNGTATQTCPDCHGTGTAQKHNQKNHHAKNHVNVTRVVGTKWTALDRTFGWRHFECKEVHVVKPTTSVTGKGHANENERAQTATTKTAERTKSSDQNRPQPKPKPKPKSTKKRTYCLLEATCDPTARLWVEIEILKSRRVWSAGWLQKESLQQLLAELELEGTGGDPCQRCHGERTAPCRYCTVAEPISLS